MKLSIYNKFINLQDGNILAFNSASCALAVIDEKYKSIINNSCELASYATEDEYKDIIHDMKKGQFIVSKNVDELKIIKYEHFKNKFESKKITLTLAPTLNCNFSCIYCYQTPDSNIMDEYVQNQIVAIVKKYAEEGKDVQVVWFGGEPLLTINILQKLSKEFIKICKKFQVNYSASIITNGYLLTDDIVNILIDCKVSSIQVTLDGIPEIHNKRRILKAKTKSNTFDVILKNIAILLNIEMNINIRINIDKTNMNNAIHLIQFLEEKGFNQFKNLTLALGKVRIYGEACNSIKDICCGIKEFSELDYDFHITAIEKGFNINNGFDYPKRRTNLCCADSALSYVIDPKGFLYKCWSDIGNTNKAIGNILDVDKDNLLEEKSLTADYILHSPFDYNRCINCWLLPICMGGCPYIVKNEGDTQCTKWKYNIEKALLHKYSKMKVQ